MKASYSRLCSLLVAAAFVASPAIQAREAPPEVSEDGLHLQKSTKTRLVYLKPGADFSAYKRIGLLECAVEFEKDWQHDFNRSRVGLEGKVSESDAERIKKDLSVEFNKVFVEELSKNGGYEIAQEVAPDVLLLRPALINVEVNAPDLMSAGMSDTIVRSAGQMTLFLELWDPTTNTILARVMDAQADQEGFARRANRVTNKAAADEILEDWADELRQRLDAVRAPPAG